MKINALEKPLETINGFNLNVELKELNTCGIVDFYSKKKANELHSFWNGEQLIIPIYGIYKLSWGFYQNSINTFYNDVKTQLGLVINGETHEEVAEITKETPSFHAMKRSNKSLTLLFREGETLALKAEMFNTENLKMKDIYLKVEKQDIEENNTFGY